MYIVREVKNQNQGRYFITGFVFWGGSSVQDMLLFPQSMPGPAIGELGKFSKEEEVCTKRGDVLGEVLLKARL